MIHQSSAVKPTLCVINFNGEKILPLALASANALQDLFATQLVIDDCSQDGSVALIRRDFPALKVVTLAKNGGAACARNAGLAQSLNHLILFMDNDVELTADCVRHLTRALAANPNAAIAVPSVLDGDRRNIIQYNGAQCHFLGIQTLVNANCPVHAADPQVRQAGSLISCCFLIDRARLPAGFRFDEDMFIYLEDHDFGVRARALGREILSVPLAHCYHGKGTEGLSIRQTGTYSKRRVFYSIRNRWIFLLKNYSLRTWLVMLPLLLFYEAAQLAIALKKGWLPEWWRALCNVVTQLPAILQRRRTQQTQRRVPDRALLTGGPIPFRSELTTSGFERAARALLEGIARSYWKVAARLI